MLEEVPFVVNSHVFPSILKACSRIIGISEGTQIHGSAIKLNTVADPYVQNGLIQMYSKCEKLFDARCLFDNMSDKTVVSWNTIITCYAELGRWDDVKNLFWSMVELSFSAPNSITLVKMISACTKSGDFEEGKWVHGYIEENGIGLSLNLGNSLMNMYAKIGEMSEAHRLFDQMFEQDVVSWTTLVSGYAGLGCLGPARELFDRMQCRSLECDDCWLRLQRLVLGVKPDKAIVSVLAACVGLEDLFTARVIHGYVCKGRTDWTNDLINSFIGIYTKCGSMDSAELLFKRMPIRNEIKCTSVMVGYAKCGAKEVALEMFNKMPYKDVVSWNALIAVFNQCNYFNESLSIFLEMLKAKVSPNNVTLISMLSACARVGALELGKWIHAYIGRNNIEMDNYLVSSLVDMYAKCGSIELAVQVFDKMHDKDLLTWSIMIGGLAMHGHGKLALELFEEMPEDGVKPDGITFIGVLSACSHAGLVNERRHYFDLMTQVYNLSPETEHYSCMVDLLGRRGLLREAKDFIDNIPRTSNGKSVWGALLGASRVHGNVELAKYTANQLLDVDPSSSGGYVLLSNVYADSSNWDDVGKVRILMKSKGISKLPGCSSIELHGVVHEFFVGDNCHPQCEQIYMMLNELEREIRWTDGEYKY
ncbi:Pentatricopeptide repeat [Macleaya cordata]|uniref:Pentatricopeptide repeat n=1 Tax=Macleaya cordata TaxID=56857 RepID=A0A200PZ63_MACCD|nr:Pentatricopeptide repeat [Macleaya cordata]